MSVYPRQRVPCPELDCRILVVSLTFLCSSSLGARFVLVLLLLLLLLLALVCLWYSIPSKPSLTSPLPLTLSLCLYHPLSSSSSSFSPLRPVLFVSLPPFLLFFFFFFVFFPLFFFLLVYVPFSSLSVTVILCTWCTIWCQEAACYCHRHRHTPCSWRACVPACLRAWTTTFTSGPSSFHFPPYNCSLALVVLTFFFVALLPTPASTILKLSCQAGTLQNPLPEPVSLLPSPARQQLFPIVVHSIAVAAWQLLFLKHRLARIFPCCGSSHLARPANTDALQRTDCQPCSQGPPAQTTQQHLIDCALPSHFRLLVRPCELH